MDALQSSIVEQVDSVDKGPGPAMPDSDGYKSSDIARSLFSESFEAGSLKLERESTS